jgi:predicted lysophospholipase L1 biosynthesis ABC-type transport system permease subunit
MTYTALDEALAELSPQQQPAGNADVVFRLKPGLDRTRALAQVSRRHEVSPVAPPPGDVRNLDLVRSYPLWLAGFLAVLGLLAVLHALLVSARRRDHQVGVLRALGFTRSQIVGAVSAQGAAMSIFGVVIGVPLGVALGRWTWSLSARQLGVGEGTIVPIAVLAIVLGGGLALLLALGASAGWWAGRSTPSRALRVP